MPFQSKLILVGIDGLLIDRAIKSGRAKTLQRLSEDGFFIELQVDLPTISGPSWSTYLTGKSKEVHKVIDNNFVDHNLREAPDFLTVAKLENPDLITYAAAGWPPLIDLNDVGPVIADAGHIRFHNDGEKLGYLQVDKEVLEHALNILTTNKPDMSFVYFCGVDEAGHLHGTLDGPYFDAIERIDEYLGQLHDAILSTGDDWLLVIITDHGHRDEGGHGGDSDQERASFVIAHATNGKHPDWPGNMLSKELVSHIFQYVRSS